MRSEQRNASEHAERFALCPTNRLLALLGQKWAPAILNLLGGGKYRYSELRRAIPSVTHKMMTQTLRVLEDNGLVHRTLVGDKPPLISEYCLTDAGRSLLGVLSAATDWAESHRDALLHLGGK